LIAKFYFLFLRNKSGGQYATFAYTRAANSDKAMDVTETEHRRFEMHMIQAAESDGDAFWGLSFLLSDKV